MTVRYIVGVDPALRNFAVSIRDNLNKHIETFNLTTPPGLTDHDSVDQITEKFFERMEKYYTPEAAKAGSVRTYVEHIVFAQKGKGTARAEAIGVVKWNLRQADFPIFGVEPSAWQSWLANEYGFEYDRDPSTNRRNRKSIKAGVHWCLHNFCNFYSRSEDENDAHAVALFGYAHTYGKRRLSAPALCRL